MQPRRRQRSGTLYKSGARNTVGKGWSGITGFGETLYPLKWDLLRKNFKLQGQNTPKLVQNEKYQAFGTKFCL